MRDYKLFSRKTMSGSNLMFQSPQEDDKAYIVGLDASLTSFGVYCRPVNHKEWYGWSLKSTKAQGSDTLRVLNLAQDVMDGTYDLPHPVALMCIEDYGPINRLSGKIAQRAELCGILKHHFLTVLKVPVVTVSPTSLKKFATGNGAASKEDMLNKANVSGYYPETHDEADAFFCGMLGELVLLGQRHGADITRTNP